MPTPSATSPAVGTTPTTASRNQAAAPSDIDPHCPEDRPSPGASRRAPRTRQPTRLGDAGPSRSARLWARQRRADLAAPAASAAEAPTPPASGTELTRLLAAGVGAPSSSRPPARAVNAAAAPGPPSGGAALAAVDNTTTEATDRSTLRALMSNLAARMSEQWVDPELRDHQSPRWLWPNDGDVELDGCGLPFGEDCDENPAAGPGVGDQQVGNGKGPGKNRDLASWDMEEDEAELDSRRIGYGFPQLRIVTKSPSPYLRTGSRFSGTQQSERQMYDVMVEIKHVDLDESFLCGYLIIQGLTDSHPTLTTYFEGEMIGPKHTFTTAQTSWGASETIDFSHWGQFTAFKHYKKYAERGRTGIRDVAQKENIFMRWKEQFVVPDHRVRNISGASFDGFYYICFNQVEGSITGIYYHTKSEKFQQLELQHIPDKGCFPSIEFR